jgi:hypothetical protein
MTSVAVPAQITTVEDKIFAGLTPLQLGLMTTPLCVGFLAYAAMPPNFRMVVYKLVIVILLEVIGLVASIRIKDQVLVKWLAVKAHYNLRPRYYVYNKNDLYLRKSTEPVLAVPKDVSEPVKVASASKPQLDIAQVVKIESIMADPRAKMRFVMGKEGTSVVIQEIKQ